MTMTWREKYVDLLRAFGVDVVIRPGWLKQSAGRGDWTGGKPVGQINHHFGNGAGAPDSDLVAMVENGYVGGPRPFVVNDLLGRDGRLFLVSSFPTGHPGKGSRSVLDRVRRGLAPLGDAGALDLPDDLPQSEAERVYYGVEVSNRGDGSPLRPGQYRTLVARNAALALACGLSADVSIQHREHSRRKPDIHRATVDAVKLRADVAALMRSGGTVPQGINTDKSGELDMDEVQVEAIVRRVVKAELAEYGKNPNYSAKDAATLLATDIGTGQSLAGALAEISGKLSALVAR
jgi:hypothetical protein